MYLIKPHFDIAWGLWPHCLSGGVQDQHEQLYHLSLRPWEEVVWESGGESHCIKVLWFFQTIWAH